MGLKKKDWEKIIYENGKIDEEQVMLELLDFSDLMDNYGKVLEHFSGLSKLNTPASVIIGDVEEHNMNKDVTKDDVKMIIDESESIEDLKTSLLNYFEI